MRVYHRTSHEAAAAILAQGVWQSKEQGEVCVSDWRDSEYTSGYGPAVVELDVPDHLLTLDDEFQTGEQHFRVKASDIAPSMINTGGRHNMLTGSQAIEANAAARFYPADAEAQTDSGELPMVEIAGVQVYVYFKNGELVVSAHFDGADETAQRPDKTVPLRVNIGGTDVYKA